MPPTQLLKALEAIRSRAKVLAVLFGIGLSLAVAVGLLLAAVLLDWLLVLPAPARAVALLAVAGGLIAAVYEWIVLPSLSRLKLSDLAGRLEDAFPQFDDRLRSTVHFVTAPTPGSPQLQEKVIAQASAMAEQIDLRGVIRPQPMYYAVGGGLAAVALLVGLVIFGNQAYVSAAVNRLSLGDKPWPKSVQIAMAGEVPRRVPVGQRIPIKIRLEKGDRASRKAVISYRYDNGPWQQELMTRADGQYTAALDARIDQGKNSGKLTVRVEAGDDSRELAPIAVVPRLELTRVDAEVLPPPYVKSQRASTINLSEQPAIVGVGSSLAVHFTFNKPLTVDKPVTLVPVAGQKLPDSSRAIAWDRSLDNLATARFSAVDPLRFTVRAVDADGFENTGGNELEVIVRDDQMPSVQIEEPRRSEDRTPDAEFDVKAIAEDDYGIDNAQLVVKRFGEKQTSQKNDWTIDLLNNGVVAPNASWQIVDQTPEHLRYRLQYHWALQSLSNANLQPGDVLEYFIRVKDNYLLNGKEHDWVSSGRLRITIISHEQWDRAVQDVFEQTFAALKQIDQSQVRNKGETDTLQQSVAKKQNFDEADSAQSQRLANQQSGAVSQTTQVADRLAQLLKKMTENKSPEDGMKQTAAEVQKQLNQISDGAMRTAASTLHNAADAKALDPAAPANQKKDDASRRAGDLAKSSTEQQKSSEQLKAAMERLGNFGGLAEAISRFQAIRDAQAKLAKDFADQMKSNIGKSPEQMNKEDQQKASEMAKQQSDLSQKTQTALNDLQKKADQLNKSDPTAAEGMKNAAQAGQRQQVPSKQQSASQSMQQNQQSQAQDQHHQIELGLDEIINNLKETEKRKLEELARQLEGLQKLVAELLQRQAGHNLDNLILQGGDARIAKLDQQDRQDLFDTAARDAKAPAEAQNASQLGGSQEQTERNTRDISHQAESLPDPTPAAKLTAAAGQMERAIVHLRNSKLPDAYDPPQVEAYRNLGEAKKAIDDALQKAIQQLQDQAEESIKQGYVKLLEQQKKLGGDVIQIDGAPKDADGNLPRPQAIRLGQLPGEQGKLQDTAKSLGDKLETLGSVVYVWANRDITRTMGEVRDELAKLKTGVPTQAEEHRIERQLKAMIDNLAQRHKDRKFADRNNGGGGGKGGNKPPTMPGEAELRLLKALQEAVADSTTAIDQQKDKDKDALVALGGRQGELRGVFDQLLQKSAQIKLGPEPDNKDQLPEEASKEDVEDQEFDKQLRADDLSADTVEKTVKLTGDRMARSRQRLALNNDPGSVTQEIQKRIAMDLDQLINLAQQQQQQASSKPGSQRKPGDKMGDPQSNPGGQQQVASNGQQKNQSQNPASTPGRQSTSSNGAPQGLDLSKQIQETMKEWGGITARERQAVQEGASEKVIEKYKRYVDDYYRSLSEEATKR